MSTPIPPSTGTTLQDAGLLTVDNRFYDRGPLVAILVRDNRGIATNISPYAPGDPPTTFFGPFAQDGNIRQDLLAWVQSGGVWQVNQTSNQGWYLIGAVDEKGGPDRKPNMKHDDAMILQSTFPFDSDITGEGITIQFTPVQVLHPVIRRLRLNLPLSDSSGNPIVEMPGQSGYVLSKPVDPQDVDRQCILIFGKSYQGQYIYTAEGYPLCRLTDIGNRKRDKSAADASSLSLTVLPDPNHVDIDPRNPSSLVLVPALFSEWIAGGGWAAASGAPVFPGLAPVASPLSATTAQVVFQGALGGGGSVTYTAHKTTSSTRTSAVVASVHTDTPTPGDVTLDISTLITGTSYVFDVTATGANTLTTQSANSNSITTD